MRRYLPDVADEPLAALYADVEIPAGDGRPHVYLDMVSTVDGAAAIRGHTRALGSHADKVVFRRLRDTCDALLVGAGTIRAEDYRPPTLRPDRVAHRRARGLAATPTLVVVTASLDLDPSLRLFSDPSRRPVVLAPIDADRDAIARLEELADVVLVGRGRVELPAALDRLGERGVTRLLCEGGPRLNGQLLDADLVDELFLTVAPVVAGGSAPRIVAASMHEVPRHADLVELREHAGELLLRYRIGAVTGS